MPISEQYQDDALGGVNLDSHAGNTQISVPGMSAGFSSNHAAFVLVTIGVLGLWIIHRVFKGA